MPAANDKPAPLPERRGHDIDPFILTVLRLTERFDLTLQEDNVALEVEDLLPQFAEAFIVLGVAPTMARSAFM